MSSSNSSPFRSLAGVARTRRRAPEVERSTFVVCQIGQFTIAFPVEQVERVLPVDAVSTQTTLTLPISLAHRAQETVDHDIEYLARQLTLRADDWSANLVVSHVFEVRAIETALVQAAGDAPPMSFVVGQYVREGLGHATRIVWVTDVARIARWHSGQVSVEVTSATVSDA
ncbi:MAG: hypothetical protein IBJ03_17270 [Gemmatimonadaceae bacterium]|nr:hypothetical protein [Gemmatimonadaceae bacterium]